MSNNIGNIFNRPLPSFPEIIRRRRNNYYNAEYYEQQARNRALNQAFEGLGLSADEARERLLNALDTYDDILTDSLQSYRQNIQNLGTDVNAIRRTPDFPMPDINVVLSRADRAKLKGLILDYKQEVTHEKQQYQERLATALYNRQRNPNNQSPLPVFNPHLPNLRRALTQQEIRNRNMSEIMSRVRNSQPITTTLPIPTTIPIRNGPILSMNKNKLNVNVISMEPFEDDETVDVVYTPDEVAKLNRSESVNITPAMIYKPEQLQGWINSGKTTNPQTRKPIALRERRKLKLTSANNKAKVNQTKNNKSKNNQSKGNPPKKGFRFSTKFPFFKTRKNRRTNRK